MNVLASTFERIKKSSFAKDSFWAMLGSVIGKGLSLVAGIIVARYLGKDIYGEYGTIRTTLTYVAIVSSFGFGYTATKFIAEYIQSNTDRIKSLLQNMMTITLIFSVFLAVILIVLAGPISTFIKSPHLESILRYFSPLIVFNALTSTQIGILSGFKSFKDIAKVNTVAGIVTFVGSAIMTYFWTLNGAVGALLLSFVVQYILNNRYIKKNIAIVATDNIHVEKREIKRILSFSTPIALQESLYTVVHWLSLLLLIKYANYGEVGLSSAASLWQSVVIFIPGVLKNVMFSYLSSSDNHAVLVKRLLLINFVSVAIPIILIFTFSGFVCSFYGETFVGLEKVLRVSVLSSAFICLSEVFCYEFISIGKPWTVFFARLLRDIVGLVVASVMIIKFNTCQAFLLAISAFVSHVLFFVYLLLSYNGKHNKYV